MSRFTPGPSSVFTWRNWQATRLIAWLSSTRCQAIVELVRGKTVGPFRGRGDVNARELLHGKQTEMFGATVFWSKRLRHSFLTNILSWGGNVSVCLHMFVCENACVCACTSNGLFWPTFLPDLFWVKLSWTCELYRIFWWLCVSVCETVVNFPACMLTSTC